MSKLKNLSYDEFDILLEQWHEGNLNISITEYLGCTLDEYFDYVGKMIGAKVSDETKK